MEIRLKSFGLTWVTALIVAHPLAGLLVLSSLLAGVL